MTIGEKIFKHRKQAGLSQEELADKMNVTRQSISLWETDQTTPSLDSLILLAEIFDVSLDELCGTRAIKDEGQAHSDNSEESSCLAAVETNYTFNLINRVNKTAAKKFNILSVVFMICAILLSVGIIGSDADNTFLIIPIFFIVLCSAWLIRLNLTLKKRTADFFKLRPNCVAKIKLFHDCFDLELTSDNTSSKSTIRYCDVKKVINSEDYILVYFDNSVVPIEKNLPDVKYDLILKLLSTNNSDSNVPQNKKIKTFLLTMFILSLLSIFIPLITAGISAHFSPLPDYPYTFPEYFWLFFVFIPLPLSSAILGIVFYIKKYKCKKNIIAGCIICALLSIYGSFTFIYKDYTIHDFGYVAWLEQTVNIDLPESGYISRAINIDDRTNSMAMVKFDNKTEISNAIVSDNRFSKDTGLIPSNLVDTYYLNITSNYHYFMIYDVTCDEANGVMNGLHTQHRFVFLAYNIDTNILFSLDFVK